MIKVIMNSLAAGILILVAQSAGAALCELRVATTRTVVTAKQTFLGQSGERADAVIIATDKCVEAGFQSSECVLVTNSEGHSVGRPEDSSNRYYQQFLTYYS